MLNQTSRTTQLVAFWLVLVAMVAASRIIGGGELTGATTALLLFASLVPTTVMWVVWRGVPPPTVAELLHSVSTPRGETDRDRSS